MTNEIEIKRDETSGSNQEESMHYLCEAGDGSNRAVVMPAGAEAGLRHHQLYY